MGKGYICKCPECDYTLKAFLGVGMMYPMTVQEEMKKLKKGRYGEQGMKFFKDHPDGSRTCENVVTRCTAWKVTSAIAKDEFVIDQNTAQQDWRDYAEWCMKLK